MRHAAALHARRRREPSALARAPSHARAAQRAAHVELLAPDRGRARTPPARAPTTASITTRPRQPAADRARARRRSRGARRRSCSHEFPLGARPGTLIHSVFEHIDFTRAERRRVAGAGRALAGAVRAGRRTRTSQPLVQGIDAVLRTPLDAADPPLTLGAHRARTARERARVHAQHRAGEHATDAGTARPRCSSASLRRPRRPTTPSACAGCARCRLRSS